MTLTISDVNPSYALNEAGTAMIESYDCTREEFAAIIAKVNMHGELVAALGQALSCDGLKGDSLNAARDLFSKALEVQP